MTNRFKAFLALFGTLALASLLSAQGTPTVVQFVAQRSDAATKVAVCNAAVNNQVTCTMTPSGANYVYITAMDLEICGDATGTLQTLVTWTSTGLTGTPIPWSYSTAINPAICTYKEISYATPVKSTTAGTAVTVVSPAAALHTVYLGNIFWFEGQ